jgi:hypothetical protein
MGERGSARGGERGLSRRLDGRRRRHGSAAGRGGGGHEVK